jgi:methionine-rich copper-binding protein CopC
MPDSRASPSGWTTIQQRTLMRLRIASFAFALGALAALGAPATSAARLHLALSRAEPAANDTIPASPAAIRLFFTETVKASGVTIRLTGSDSTALALGAVTVDTGARKPAVASVTNALRAGTYLVAWRALAADGHPVTGNYRFTVRAADTH